MDHELRKRGTSLDFVHRFVPATQPARKPLLLLHGTGGDENDLLPLGERLSAGAALLSPRGQVLENGMPRFFRRLAEGVFDIDDLKRRTEELAQFTAAARVAYGIDKPIAVGFSNGANIAASLLLTRPEALTGAVLMRATTPFVPQNLPPLAGIPVLILSGAMDPLVSADKRERLAQLLAAAGANVEGEVIATGHNLTAQDIASASAWLERHG
jgi:phospholipase/carboxylesterase